MSLNSLPKKWHKPMRVIGIDLGTTNSVMTEIKWQAGTKPEPRVIQIKQETHLGIFTDILFPSVLAIYSDQLWVGEGANRLKKNPQDYILKQGKNLFFETKLDMGIGKTYVNAPEGFRCASDIAGHIIKAMIQYAKSVDDSPIDHVVITVPASFQVSQRNDTLRSAKLAGIEISGSNLLDEPIAALIDFITSTDSVEKLPQLHKESNILVFDFGGGTCDVAIMNIAPDEDGRNFKRSSRAVSRYHELGGADIDIAIVYEVLIPKLCKENGLLARELSYAEKKNILEMNLLTVAENLKIMLSNTIRRQMEMSEFTTASEDITVSLPQTMKIEVQGRTFTMTKPSLSLNEFNKLMRGFLDEDLTYITETDYRSFTSIFSPIDDALEHSFLEAKDIDFVLLVGGSCMIPQVEESIKKFFYKAHVHLIDTEERIQTCVSRGAALNALYRAVSGSNWFEPVCHQQISINTQKGLIPLIPAGQKLAFPGEDIWAENKALKVPNTVISDGEDIRIEIVAGRGDDTKVLYTSVWRLLPIINKGETIKLSYKMSADQVLELRLALESQEDIEYAVTIENPITHVVNVNELQRKIMELEEEIKTSKQRRMNYKVKELAQLYAQQGKYEKAIEFYKRVLKKSSRPDVYILNQLGLWYGDIKDYKNQEKYYLEAARLGEWSGPLFNLALAYYRRDKYDDAIVYLNQAIEKEDDPAYYVLMHDLYLKVGKEAEARNYSDLALKKYRATTLEYLESYQLTWYERLAISRKDTVLLEEIKKHKKQEKQDTENLSSELPDARGDLTIWD